METSDSQLTLDSVSRVLDEALTATFRMQDWEQVVSHWRGVVTDIAELYRTLGTAEQSSLIMVLNDLGNKYDAETSRQSKWSQWNRMSIQGLVYQLFCEAVPGFDPLLSTVSPFVQN